MPMKKTVAVIVTFLSCLALCHAQKSLPNAEVISEAGQTVSISSLCPQGVPVVISFWDTACKPCLQELGAFSDVYDDWKDEFDFEIIAVSTDDARSSSKAIPLAKGRGWPFVLARDPNGNLKRAMNVQSNPTLFIVDAKGNIVYSHIGYTAGSEKEIHDILSKL